MKCTRGERGDQGAEDAEKEVQIKSWEEWRMRHPLFTTKEKITKATADTFLEGLGEEFASVEHLHECTRNGLGWEAEKLRRRVEQHQAIIQVVADTLKAAWGITDEDALRISRNWQGFPIYGQGTSYSVFNQASLAYGWMNMAHIQAGYELRSYVIAREEEKPAKEDEPEPPIDGTGSDVRGGSMDGGNQITQNRQEPQDEEEDVLVVTREEEQALKEQGLDVALIETWTWQQANELEERIRSLRGDQARRKRRAEEYEENQRAQRRRLELGAASEGYDMDKFWKDHCRAKALGAQLREGDDPSNACRADLQLRC